MKQELFITKKQSNEISSKFKQSGFDDQLLDLLEKHIGYRPHALFISLGFNTKGDEDGMHHLITKKIDSKLEPYAIVNFAYKTVETCLDAFKKELKAYAMAKAATEDQ